MVVMNADGREDAANEEGGQWTLMQGLKIARLS